MGMSSGVNSGPMGEINVTPLVDVMLVLLIIFMVTAPMMNAGVDIDLREVEDAGHGVSGSSEVGLGVDQYPPRRWRHRQTHHR